MNSSDPPTPTAEQQALLPQPATSNPETPTPFAYRGNGKIARLPKPIRDQINHWMLDGVSYPDIIQRLGQHGQDLKPASLGEWKKRGHQDWLLEQAWLAQTRARQEPASDLSANFDATHISHAALQLGTLQIFEAFRHLRPKPADHSTPTPHNDLDEDLSTSEHEHQPDNNQDATSDARQPNASPPDPDSSPAPAPRVPAGSHPNSKSNTRKSDLDLLLGGDSAAFVRLLNALARASRETMLVQKYQDACARARAALNPMKDPNRKLTDAERRAIVLHVDDILGLSSEDDSPEPESPILPFPAAAQASPPARVSPPQPPAPAGP